MRIWFYHKEIISSTITLSSILGSGPTVYPLAVYLPRT